MNADTYEFVRFIAGVGMVALLSVIALVAIGIREACRSDDEDDINWEV